MVALGFLLGGTVGALIYVVPADNFGCGWYRLRWAAETLVAQGHDVKIEPAGKPTCLRGVTRNGHLAELHIPRDCDTLVMQRPTSRWLPEIITNLRDNGVSVVLDVDDDLRHIHPSNVAFRGLHPKMNANNNWHHTEVACRMASLVTVSTPALAERYGVHGRTAVVPNCVPERFLSIPRVDSDVIGWAGSIYSHPDDLQATGNALARLGGPLRVVGNADGLRRILGLASEPDETGYVSFHEWGETVATIGVGIAPLADTVFNAAKSYLKPLEMSALGVPWVASDRIEYRKLHEMGCGAVVNRAKDWETKLRILRSDTSYRQETSERGRAVAAGMTIEANAWRWLEAWEHARELDALQPVSA